jgi:Tfp pilus assembly protein PilX
MSRALDKRPPGEVDPTTRGYALPSVLAALVTLTLLGLAAFQSARLDSRASASLVASIRAFYAAEAGLVLLEADRAAGVDSVTIPGVRVETSREDILRLSDGGRLVRLLSEATVTGRLGVIEGRRQVSRLRHLSPDATGHRVPGSWRETIRP